MEYGPVIALSLVTLLAVALWGAVQLGIVSWSKRKGAHSAFAHRASAFESLQDVDRRRTADREAGVTRHVYKPNR